jgi:hypothetical protein
MKQGFISGGHAREEGVCGDEVGAMERWGLDILGRNRGARRARRDWWLVIGRDGRWQSVSALWSAFWTRAGGREFFGSQCQGEVVSACEVFEKKTLDWQRPGRLPAGSGRGVRVQRGGAGFVLRRRAWSEATRGEPRVGNVAVSMSTRSLIVGGG